MPRTFTLSAALIFLFLINYAFMIEVSENLIDIEKQTHALDQQNYELRKSYSLLQKKYLQAKKQIILNKIQLRKSQLRIVRSLLKKDQSDNDKIALKKIEAKLIKELQFLIHKVYR